MTFVLRRKAREIFRDYNADGMPASGPHDPNVADIQLWFAQVLRGLLAPEHILSKRKLRDWGSTIEDILEGRINEPDAPVDKFEPMFARPIEGWRYSRAWLPVCTVNAGWVWLRRIGWRPCVSTVDPTMGDVFVQYHLP